MPDENPTRKTTRPSYTREDGVALREHLETQISALREYLELHLISLRTYLETRLDAMERATTLAVQAMDKRLEGMNEFRAALKDTTSRLATRDEMHTQINQLKSVADRLNEDINELKRYRAAMEGKASQQSVNTVTVLSLLGLALSIIGIVLKFLGN